MMKKAISDFIPESLAVFGTGALSYTGIEILWRGFSHWTMALTGGFCLVCLYRIQRKYPEKPFLLRCAAGALVITAAEFSVGCIVNRILHWGVWDYSKRPFNLLGQVCPLFSLLWFLLCVPALPLCSLLHRCLCAGIFQKRG